MTFKRPDIVCVGATKAGTTWLFQNLSSRKDVWLSPIKEINLGLAEYDKSSSGWTSRYLMRQIEMLHRKRGANLLGVTDEEYQLYIRDLIAHSRADSSWYDLVFRHAQPNQLLLDVSPSYAAFPINGINFLSRNCPNAQFIYLIRDPIERAKSHLRMLISKRKKLPRSTAEWLTLATDESLWRGGNYADYIPKWQRTLGKRISFFPFADIASRPNQVLKQIEEFCDLPRCTYPKANLKINRTPRIIIPLEIQVYLSARADQDLNFIRNEFGSSFVNP